MPLIIHETFGSEQGAGRPYVFAASMVGSGSKAVKVSVNEPMGSGQIRLEPPQALMLAAKLVHSAMAAEAGEPVDLKDPMMSVQLHVLFADALQALTRAGGRVSL